MIGLRWWRRNGSPATRLAPPAAAPAARPADPRAQASPADVIYDQILAQIEAATVIRLSRAELSARIERLVADIADQRRLLINREEQQMLIAAIVDDMIGLGPLELPLADASVSDILVNGPHEIYVERRGRLVLTEYRFRNDRHVLHVAQRIASSVGRRVNESSPILDARLADGSRVNVTVPPLSLIGPCISIRKFSRGFLDFPELIALDTLSPELAQVLKIAARCRLNILISGGTGSGKTTLLNALSGAIDRGERIVTIEDTAELQLRHPHVIPFETRPPNLEGRGEVTQRDLVRNALRVRPDRIIVGDVRGAEAFDMMQAMNTGHDGSLSTIHANGPRDALARVESMILAANVGLPSRAIRAQLGSAVDLIVQMERLRDGSRRVVAVTEVVGIAGEGVTLRNLFVFKYGGENPDGTLKGTFERTGVRPRFLPRLEYYGLAGAFIEASAGSGRRHGADPGRRRRRAGRVGSRLPAA